MAKAATDAGSGRIQATPVFRHRTRIRLHSIPFPGGRGANVASVNNLRQSGNRTWPWLELALFLMYWGEPRRQRMATLSVPGQKSKRAASV